jgi:hypothetical protein
VERIKCQFRVEVLVNITATELDHLMKLSRRHYDRRCRELSAENPPRGLLGRIKLLMDDAETVEYVLTWDDVDILCKVAEGEQHLGYPANGEPRLWHPMRQIFAEMRQESERVNQSSEDTQCLVQES